MANQRNLINAFDDCIERLSTGENLDDILKDYPDSADYLRDLLMIGERISEVHNTDDESTSAQSRGRDKLQAVLKEKPKRKRIGRPFWYLPTIAAGIFTLIIGVGLLISAIDASRRDNYSWFGTEVASSNSTTESLIRETVMQMTQNSQSTQVAYTMSTPTAYVENFDTTATALLMPTMTINVSTPSIIPTSVASMEEATAVPQLYETGDPDFPAMTVTAQAQVYAQMTATELIDVFDATSNSGGGNGVNDAFKTTSFPALTATPQPTSTTTATPSPAPTQTPAGTQVADGSYVSPSQNNNAPTPLPALIPLNAGEIDDNEDWDTYLLYRREFMARNIPFYDIDVTGRHIINVIDETGQPVLGATVRIFANDVMIAETLTYATGKTLFLPNADERSRGVIEFFVIVEKDGVSQQFILNLTDRRSWDVTLPITVNRDAVTLDVLFLMDTTSSMGDEISQLQNNILHISDAVDGFADNVDVHYGLVLYREHNNVEYLTRRHDFTSDVAEFQTYLNAVTANSGDNNPDWDEALNVGLDESLQLMSWRDDDTIKLIFLVADAAPHINHALEPITYDQSIRTALARGIKIHPIASSGLEAQGEFIFRQIAQVTMGHFLFLTYDNGIAGTTGDVRPELEVGLPDSLDPISGYTVNRLADVVLRLIQDEILTYRGIIQP